ncbi:hypothetical protein [Nostoc sp.]|uniref:hypothetical protein n=1 Tax=Nostoc sp. TaxID=1180 RepID=UPI002FF9FF6C
MTLPYGTGGERQATGKDAQSNNLGFWIDPTNKRMGLKIWDLCHPQRVKAHSGTLIQHEAKTAFSSI